MDSWNTLKKGMIHALWATGQVLVFQKDRKSRKVMHNSYVYDLCYSCARDIHKNYTNIRCPPIVDQKSLKNENYLFL